MKTLLQEMVENTSKKVKLKLPPPGIRHKKPWSKKDEREATELIEFALPYLTNKNKRTYAASAWLICWALGDIRVEGREMGPINILTDLNNHKVAVLKDYAEHPVEL